MTLLKLDHVFKTYAATRDGRAVHPLQQVLDPDSRARVRGGP